MLMCLVLGRILGSMPSSRAPVLSSNVLQWTMGEVQYYTGKPLFFNSIMSSIIGITSRRDCDVFCFSGR